MYVGGPYYTDRGLGLALIGGFAFNNAGYQARFPPQPGYARRAKLYELHHHLNHLNIFGSGYRGGCLRLMRKILAG